ncbi:MAG: hypothetical protein ACXQS8_03375, partial [Candidatus Helarchaeales archaeon]
FGSKIELTWILILFVIMGAGFTIPIYYFVRTGSELGKSTYGFKLMFLPLAINGSFLLLEIILLQMTIIFS